MNMLQGPKGLMDAPEGLHVQVSFSLCNLIIHLLTNSRENGVLNKYISLYGSNSWVYEWFTFFKSFLWANVVLGWTVDQDLDLDLIGGIAFQ